MLRLALPAVLLAALLGCPCPTAPCPAGVLVRLRVDTWERGTYALSVTMPDLSLACVFEATADGAKPALLESSCNGLLAWAEYVPDTGGTIDANLIEVKGELGRLVDGAALPATVDLQLTHTVDGAERVLVSAEQPLDWFRRVETQRACVDDCRATIIDVAAP